LCGRTVPEGDPAPLRLTKAKQARDQARLIAVRLHDVGVEIVENSGDAPNQRRIRAPGVLDEDMTNTEAIQIIRVWRDRSVAALHQHHEEPQVRTFQGTDKPRQLAAGSRDARRV